MQDFVHQQYYLLDLKRIHETNMLFLRRCIIGALQSHMGLPFARAVCLAVAQGHLTIQITWWFLNGLKILVWLKPMTVSDANFCYSQSFFVVVCRFCRSLPQDCFFVCKALLQSLIPPIHVALWHYSPSTTHTIHVWYIYLHLPYKSTKCR